MIPCITRRWYVNPNLNLNPKLCTPKPKLLIFGSRTPNPKLLTAKLEGTGTNPRPRIRPLHRDIFSRSMSICATIEYSHTDQDLIYFYASCITTFLLDMYYAIVGIYLCTYYTKLTTIPNTNESA